MDSESNIGAVTAVSLAPGIFLRLLHDVDGWRFLSWSYASGQEAAPAPPAPELRRTFSTRSAAVQHFEALWPRYAALGHAISEAERARTSRDFMQMKLELEALERLTAVYERTDALIRLSEAERHSYAQIRQRVRYLARVISKRC